MKKIPALLILALTVIAAGCKKKSSTPDPIIPMGITAKINGVAWTGGTPSYSSLTGSIEYFELSAEDATGRVIEFAIKNFRSRGTHHIPSSTDSAYYATYDSNYIYTYHKATTGQVIVQSVTDSTVGGTFSFSGDGNTVTEGLFNVHYQ